MAVILSALPPFRPLRPWLSPDRADAPTVERRPPEPRWWDRGLALVAVQFRRRWHEADARGRRVVRLTLAREATMAARDDAGLLAAAAALRPRLVAQGFTPRLVAESFALIREATFRRRGLRHHAVQVLGAEAILRGRIAEMATGEGKTVTAALTAGCVALAGVQVHVITVNDYLVARDAAELTPVFEAIGLTVGVVLAGQSPAARAAAYACDIVYGSNKEMAFDYLRDRIAARGLATATRAAAARLLPTGRARPAPITQGLAFALVDEADLVLIDEARTPLIISAAVGESGAEPPYAAMLSLARALEEGADYRIDRALRRVELTAAGKSRLAAAGDALAAEERPGPWSLKRAREDLATQALSALHLFHRDQHYIVVEGEARIVDEATGRVMADRKWERGLQQLVETKEGLEPSVRRETTGRLTYQQWFGRYLWFGGMSGSAAEAGRELHLVYERSVVRIPTHRRSRRRWHGLRLYGSQQAKWVAVSERCHRMAAKGRPVLVGTRSVKDSEALSEVLAAAGISHRVLNARQDAEEAAIVAEAGEAGRVTVATAMAGRGTDIRPDSAAREAGGLHVILTGFHESGRTDRQLYGRAGRQGDPGSAEAIVAVDDELFRDHAPVIARALSFGRAGRLPALVARVLKAVAQRRAEAKALTGRRLTQSSGRNLEKMLGFANRPD
jgi:preprotein translocase subunit SecA